MTSYRLKNRALQRNLDEVTGGQLSKFLKEVAAGDIDAIEGNLVIRIPVSHLELCEEYDPKKWNLFPTVTPPTEVDMRVEIEDGRGYMAWWDGHNWRTGTHGYSDDDYVNAVWRFRPWEDPE